MRTFVGFNITSKFLANQPAPSGTKSEYVLNNITDRSTERYNLFHTGRDMAIYDDEMNSHRAFFFPGHARNRLLTHFYGLLYLSDPVQDRILEGFARDRMKYLDEIFDLSILRTISILCPTAGRDFLTF